MSVDAAVNEAPCVCDTDFTCMADEHDEGRCDACETPGIYGLCCADHQARMCSSCASANHAARADALTKPPDGPVR